MLYYTINAIGAFGPQISVVLSLLFLRHKPLLALVYITGFLLNTLLAYILKGLFQQPRPTDETTSFNLEQIYRKKTGFDRFGMPSGHSQSTLYSTAFLYFALKDGNVNILMIVLSLITLYQRLESRHHTPSQVVVGAFIGVLVGYSFFTYGEKQVKGLLKNKKDDNAKRST
jgi:membrane-associated phospholipid phosphatase